MKRIFMATALTVLIGVVGLSIFGCHGPRHHGDLPGGGSGHCGYAAEQYKAK